MLKMPLDGEQGEIGYTSPRRKGDDLRTCSDAEVAEEGADVRRIRPQTLIMGMDAQRTRYGSCL